LVGSKYFGNRPAQAFGCSGNNGSFVHGIFSCGGVLDRVKVWQQA
jgi:hypothetical protein